MKKYLVLFILHYLLCIMLCHAQNKSGYGWIVGNNASYGKFDGTTNRPQTGSFYNLSSPNFPYAFTGGHSNICDSATGKLLLLCNGMQLFDTLGNIILNGDTLVPLKMYLKNAYPNAPFSQGSIILPKGNNGEYYVIIPTVTDSVYDAYWTNNNGKYPYNEILVHTVDMKANGGMGKVIEKNKVILYNVDLAPTMMQACRHSNGIDWWLLKQGLDSNIVYRFLVTKDSIYGPFVQKINGFTYGFDDEYGQSSFSRDGKKYAFVRGKKSKLFLADFDRCTGELSNPQVYTIPIDSTTIPNPLPHYVYDSLVCGGSFSPNGKYFYITRRYNIYQFEINEPDSSLAWFHVKHGSDTTLYAFEYYGSLQLGIDDRMYIGKGGGSFKQFSVLDKPDEKGMACSFCRKCFRVDNAYGGLNTPPNVPNFNLGADLSKPCWPLYSPNYYPHKQEIDIRVYPNPASTMIYILNKKGKKKELFNMLGELLYTTTKDEIEVLKYTRGIYIITCDGISQKVMIE